MGAKYSIRVKDLVFFLAGFGAFFTGSAIRYGIYSNMLLQQHCVLFIAGMLLVFFLSNQAVQRDLSRNGFDKLGIYISASVIFISLFIVLIDSGTSKLNSFVSIILPVFVVAVRFLNKKDFLDFYQIWMKIMSVCVVLMFVTEVFDYISDFRFSQWMYDFTKVESFGRMLSGRRPVSYMGHSLFSSELFLAYYILRHLLNKIQNKKDGIVWFALCLAGSVMTQGRAGTALLIIAFLLFNLEWKRFKYVIILAVLMAVGYYFGLFDVIIERFVSSIYAGDISTGRNTSLEELLRTNQLHFYAFHGQTIEYNGTVTTLGMALEYPVVNWAYTFGYIVSFMITVSVFVYPLFLSIYRKQKEIFIALLMIMLDVNTFTGISSNGSKPLLFYTFVFIILNVSNYFYYNKSTVKKITGEK